MNSFQGHLRVVFIHTQDMCRNCKVNQNAIPTVILYRKTSHDAHVQMRLNHHIGTLCDNAFLPINKKVLSLKNNAVLCEIYSFTFN
jgi:hypothetical protein